MASKIKRRRSNDVRRLPFRTSGSPVMTVSLGFFVWPGRGAMLTPTSAFQMFSILRQFHNLLQQTVHFVAQVLGISKSAIESPAFKSLINDAFCEHRPTEHTKLSAWSPGSWYFFCDKRYKAITPTTTIKKIPAFIFESLTKPNYNF